jgi:hypothetical protein
MDFTSVTSRRDPSLVPLVTIGSTGAIGRWVAPPTPQETPAFLKNIATN